MFERVWDKHATPSNPHTENNYNTLRKTQFSPQIGGTSGLTNGITPADYVGGHFEPHRWSRAGALDARHACKRCKDGGTLEVSIICVELQESKTSSNQEHLETRRQFPLPGIGSVAVTRTCPRLLLLVIFLVKSFPVLRFPEPVKDQRRNVLVDDLSVQN